MQSVRQPVWQQIVTEQHLDISQGYLGYDRTAFGYPKDTLSIVDTLALGEFEWAKWAVDSLLCGPEQLTVKVHLSG